jgi:hypothetical protein
MVRCGRLRSFIQELSESQRIEKISFVLPFFVIIIDIILIEHALRINEHYIIFFTTLLFFLSVLEVGVVIREIHGHYQQSNFERLLTIKLDDFILENIKQTNVKIIVEDFIEKNPNYESFRNEVYHTTCQILEAHKEEELEKELIEMVGKIIDKQDKPTVDSVVNSFIKKYPKYKKYRGEIYKITAQILSNKLN